MYPKERIQGDLREGRSGEEFHRLLRWELRGMFFFFAYGTGPGEGKRDGSAARAPRAPLDAAVANAY